MKNISLTNLAKTSGCAAKISPHLLSMALSGLKKKENKNLLVGFDTSDDAAVYKINDDVAIVSTLDFFTPVANDGYNFGLVAAANAISDIYAMGATPLYALNIVCFPASLDINILHEILRGGQDKINEANCSLVGGHSINDDVPKYGLSVTGIIHPDKILRNNNISLNEVIFLTKPIGVGTINTAVKGGVASKSQEELAIKNMAALNKYPIDMIEKFNIKAMTDVTGFGLIGHLSEMAKDSGYSIFLDTKNIPILDGALDFAREGILPAGLYKNKNHYAKFTSSLYDDVKNTPLYDILFDPQTSGGLLIAVDKQYEKEFEKYLIENNFLSGKKIATVIQKQEQDIIIG